MLAMKLEEEWNTKLKTDEEERQEAQIKPGLKKVSPKKNKFEILCSCCGDNKYSNAEAYNIWSKLTMRATSRFRYQKSPVI